MDEEMIEIEKVIENSLGSKLHGVKDGAVN